MLPSTNILLIMKHIIFMLGLALLCVSCQTKEYSLSSPNGETTLSFMLTEEGVPTYSVTKKSNTILLPSPLGVRTSKAELTHKFHIVNIQTSSLDETWEQVWGEETTVRNHYNEVAITLQNDQAQQLLIRFRAFDDGVAFRYEYPAKQNDSLVILDECTEYHFAEDAHIWTMPYDVQYYESLWTRSALTELKDTVCSPVTLELADGSYIALHEANLTDYAAVNFAPIAGKTILTTYLTPWSTGEKVFGVHNQTVSPWRTIILADDLNELAMSRIMLNLNEPCKIEDTSWIQPMKYIGIWWGMHMEKYTWSQGKKHGATTANTKAYIDFAAAHNMGGVLVEGWNYGWDGDWSANGDKFSFTKPYPDFDIDYLTDYAAKKGVKLIGHHETGGSTLNYEAQLDSAYAFYNKYGIVDVKTGYVNAVLDGKELHKSQYGVRHYRKVIETAAKYHITIDNHEPVMPTGLQRTYPNLMTQEGVRGQEWDAWSTDGGSPAEHTCVMPFTRGLAGPMDFTFGTFHFENTVHPQTHVHATIAKQLALYVVIYSPLQMASDLPEHYEGKPAFAWIEQVPVDWQKSIVLDGKIGDYVITARQDKHSSDWYVGAITDENPRTLTLDLSQFLEVDRQYQLTIYADAPEADCETNPTPVDISTQIVNGDEELTLYLAPGGGCAIRVQLLD